VNALVNVLPLRLALALLSAALLAPVALLLTPAAGAQEGANPWAGSLQLMLEAVEVDAAYHGWAAGRDELSARVLAAVAAVPRHEFVPAAQVEWAYENRSIPLPYGRTLPKPYFPAVMAELLALSPRARVLEVGTGSGYQAAVLSPLAGQIFTLEPVAELATEASARLARLGFDNVTVARGDGRDGWPEHAPYDAILVTLATSEIPRALLDQLRPGGTLLIPLIDAETGLQALTLVHKNAKSKLRPRPRALIQTSFDPLP